jgi:hypothetical protein
VVNLLSYQSIQILTKNRKHLDTQQNISQNFSIKITKNYSIIFYGPIYFSIFLQIKLNGESTFLLLFLLIRTLSIKAIWGTDDKKLNFFYCSQSRRSFYQRNFISKTFTISIAHVNIPLMLAQ